ncbi:MAG TPA: XrtA/PEP-CTERM system TPR-repeat protein PrsT, partial [Stellaceae bacterium]|nr:XrtA/PEP-CTERM system TPR-repeat protein PrsT [Stellaceae bacterium]
MLVAVAGAATYYVRERRASEPQDAAEQSLREQEIRLRDALGKAPTDVHLRLELAEVELKLGEYPEAEVDAQRAAREGAPDDDVAPVLAEATLYQGKLPLLLSRVAPGKRPPKAESRVRAALGLAHLERREFADAQRLLQEAARLDPDALGPHLGLVRALLAEDHAKEAEAELARARSLGPDNVEVMRLDAEFAWRRGDAAEALAELGRILAAHPGDLKARALRATILIGQHKLDDAHRDLAEMLKAAPNSITGNYLDALVSAMQGDMARANDKLTTVNEHFQQFPAGYYLQGVVRYALGLYDLANTSLSYYVLARPDDPQAQILLAAVALRLRDPGRAIDLLRPVVTADPTDEGAATGLAQAYVAAGDRDAAMQWLLRSADAIAARAEKAAAPGKRAAGSAAEALPVDALVDKHDDPGTKAWLRTLAALQSGELSKAAATIDAVAAAKDADDLTRDIQGVVRARQKKDAAVEAIFAALIDHDPRFLDPRRNLAQLYAARHDPERAKKEWLALLDRAPGDVGALVGLAQIALAGGDIAEAIDRLVRAQKTLPDNRTIAVNLLKLRVARKEKVAATATALAATYPNDLDVADAAATALADTGDPADGDEILRRFAVAHPQSVAALDRYAALRERMGDPAGARALLVRALGLARDAQHLDALVAFDRKQGGDEAALATARAYQEKLPVPVALAEADILAAAHRGSEAAAVLEAAQEAHPNTALVIRLARLEVAAGDLAGAAKRIEAWLAAHPDEWLARLELGQVYLMQSDAERARAAYEAVLAEAPRNPVALNNLAWIYLKTADP